MAANDADVKVLCNHINGVDVAPQGGVYMDNPNPATAKVIGKIPQSGPEDIDAAVAAAKAAFPAWNARPTAERADLLNKIADLLERDMKALAACESADNGKPVSLAMAVDIPRAVSNFRFFAGAIRHDSTECHQMPGALNYALRRGVGVAGLITPWNLPLYLLTWKVAPALACGNTVVCKPSEITPMTASMLAALVKEAGVPDGVFNLVHGRGRDVGDALVGHRDTSIISFTGGTVTGRQVYRTSAEHFKKLSLELGGKNATIVFDDCDFDSTVDGVYRASFANQGEICLCGSRLFIQKGIYDKFLAALVAKAKTAAAGMGDPSSATCTFGSLVSLEHRDKVERYVKLARETDGVDILCGGERPTTLPAPFDQGAFYPPTIIAGAAITHPCSVEEIFGPVLMVHAFDTQAEVVAAANNTDYGLAGSVWTRDLARAHQVCADVHTGMLWVNTWLYRDLRVPFGGVKYSGLGREGGHHSIDFYSELKNVCIKL